MINTCFGRSVINGKQYDTSNKTMLTISDNNRTMFEFGINNLKCYKIKDGGLNDMATDNLDIFTDE